MIFRRKTRIAVRIEESMICRLQSDRPVDGCPCTCCRAHSLLREQAAYWEHQARLRAGKDHPFGTKEEK